ncbi:MAG: 1,4-beta-xylanase, partial [Cytophagales bacterium]|nr:1,4-beta-xylanase [Cytophagales bacterium]
MHRLSTHLCLLVLCLLPAALLAQRKIWTPAEANAWYAKQPWLAGSNYAPQNAINQLEMWQAETFDPQTVDKELGWAKGLGFNTMRVFLHDKLWVQDPEGFLSRLETFLTLCQKHNIRPMLVLFDSVWDPHPQLGRQRDPKPGLHNSGWVQGPGAAILADSTKYPLLESYVKGVVGHYRDDARI